MLTVVIDDGAAGYTEGLATGQPLSSTGAAETAPDAVADAAGNLHAVYLNSGAITYLFKPKGAAAWQAPVDVGTAAASDPRVVPDSLGNLHIVYSAGNEVFIRTRAGGSGTWGAAVQVSSLPSGTSTEPDAAADGLGRVHVVWQDNGAGSGTNDIRYRRREADGTWSTESTAGNLGDDRTPRVGANNAGAVSIVWNLWTTTAQEIYETNPTGIGTFTAPERLDTTAFRSVEPDVVVGNDGAIHVGFHDDNNGNWEVAYTRKAPVGGPFTAPQYFTSPGLVDAQVSLALAPDGALHASWQGTGTVYTSRNAGGTWGTPKVLMVEVGASFTSVAVDGNNRAYVLAQAQKTGVTNGGAADLWSYADAAAVVGRRVYYNNSFFDGNNAAQNAQDDNAIAPDKLALLPGQAATFANYTSFSKGLNGLMVDVAGLPAGTLSLAAGDFEFRAGNTTTPGTWGLAPAPLAIGVRKGAGVGGSDRVVLTWADGAIQKQWLSVQLKANAATGLAAPDVFYVGNAVGETGNAAGNTFVDGADFAGVRDNPRGFANPAPLDFRYDINRDRFVDGADLAIVRDNPTGFANSLKLFTAPAAPAPVASSPWNVNATTGYDGDYRTAGPASAAGTAYASWLFSNLPNGTYELQATWEPLPTNASNTPLTVSVGSGGGRQEFVVNQRNAPVGAVAGGRTFQTLASLTVTNGNGAFRVFLPGRGDGNLAADAVRLFQPSTVENITFSLDAADGVPAKELDPDVIADTAGNLHQVYTEGPNTNDNFRAFYRFKALGSNAWTNPTLVGGNGSVGGTRIARDSANNLVVAYHDQNQIWVTTRAAAGGAWSTPVRISGTYGDGSPRKALLPNLAIDPQNRVHVVWHENTAPQGEASLYHVFYRIFQGGAWQAIEQVSTVNATNNADPDIAVATDGRAFVTFTAPGADLVFRERAAAGGWSGVFTLDSVRSGGSSITVDANNNLHVTWIEDTSGGSGGSLWESAYRSRINGVWGATHIFPNPGATDIEPKVAVKPDGTMTAIWADYNDLYIARFSGGLWSAPVRLADEVGATTISLIYNPIDGAIHMLAQARKLGYTYSDSWDVLYYTE